MFLRFYLLAVAWVLVGSAVGQIFLPEAIASGSTWGLAAGWQREIGFFDIGMAVVTFRAVRSNDLIVAPVIPKLIKGNLLDFMN